MILLGVPIGWHLLGIRGVLWAVALSEVPAMAVVWHGMVKENLLSLKMELRSVVFFSLGLAVGYALLLTLPAKLSLRQAVHPSLYGQ